jgi:hypothetical protein
MTTSWDKTGSNFIGDRSDDALLHWEDMVALETDQMSRETGV